MKFFRVREAFDKYDKDESNGIDYAELKDLLHDLGFNFDDKQCNAIAGL